MLRQGVQGRLHRHVRYRLRLAQAAVQEDAHRRPPFASATAFSAAPIIVSAACTFGCAALRSNSRPSSAFDQSAAYWNGVFRKWRTAEVPTQKILDQVFQRIDDDLAQGYGKFLHRASFERGVTAYDRAMLAGTGIRLD